MTGPSIGTTNTEWLDYPDLAWSDTFLYVGIDHGTNVRSSPPKGPGTVWAGRRIFARVSLADIVAATDVSGKFVGWQYGEFTQAGSNTQGLSLAHFVQTAPNRMVVAGLKDTSHLTILSWPDSDNNLPAPVDQAFSSISNNWTSTAPDGTDWVNVQRPGNITGAVYRRVSLGLGNPNRDEYMFAFDAGVNSPGRPQSYVRLETITPDGANYKAVEEYDIWNASYAYANAALGTDGLQIGMTLGVGGAAAGAGPTFPQHAVGYKDDFLVFTVTTNTGVQGGPAPQAGRFGDYFNNRLVPGTAMFGAEVYDVVVGAVPAGSPLKADCGPAPGSVGCTTTVRYVQYGRPVSPIIPPR